MGCAHHGAVVRRREVVLGSWVAMDTVGEFDRRTSTPLVGGAAQRPAHLRSRSLLDFDLTSPTVSITTQRPRAGGRPSDKTCTRPSTQRLSELVLAEYAVHRLRS